MQSLSHQWGLNGIMQIWPSMFIRQRCQYTTGLVHHDKVRNAAPSKSSFSRRAKNLHTSVGRDLTRKRGFKHPVDENTSGGQ
mmetsp:Transcript_7225/g.16025  ORF Transcript_7225/g.16025 Transcript_7225/m.16025 type:complete len:82 (+) Transcript_7225:1012-1257(+)